MERELVGCCRQKCFSKRTGDCKKVERSFVRLRIRFMQAARAIQTNWHGKTIMHLSGGSKGKTQVNKIN